MFESGICRTFGAEVPVEFQAQGCEQWIEPVPF